MRRRALSTAVFPLLALLACSVACSTFSSTAPEPGTEDGGAGEGGTPSEAGATDAAGDAATSAIDSSGPPMSADADAGNAACTVFDTLPSAATGWAAAIGGTAGALMIVTQAGRSALDAHVEANNQRAALVHDVTPGVAGNITIETDFIAATSAGSGGSLVELLVLECSTPAVKIALEVEPGGALLVESSPNSGATLLNLPTTTWRTLKLVVTGNVYHVEIDGTPELPHTMTATFASAVGCTVAVGAKATGNIGATIGYYARACIR